jgi:tetratricopeptide (TPR) repeat protein
VPGEKNFLYFMPILIGAFAPSLFFGPERRILDNCITFHYNRFMDEKWPELEDIDDMIDQFLASGLRENSQGISNISELAKLWSEEKKLAKNWFRLYQKSKSLLYIGKYVKALFIAKKALKVALEIKGIISFETKLNWSHLPYPYQYYYIHYHTPVAECLSNLAEIYQVQGLYIQAEHLFKRALTIFNKSEGYPMAECLSNLAENYRAQGKYAQAKPLFEHAVKIYSFVLGLGHPIFALNVSNLAKFCYVQGQYAQAESLFKLAMEIYEKVFRLDHPDVIASLENLVELYRATNRESEAEKLEAKKKEAEATHIRAVIKKKRKNRQRWLLSLIVTVLGSATLEIAYFLIGSMGMNKKFLLPRTYFSLWLCALMVCIVYIVKKCDIKLGDYFGILTLGMLLATFIWIFVPDSLKIEDNYFGIELSVSKVLLEDEDYEDIRAEFPLTSGVLYRNDDPVLVRVLKNAKSFNENIYVHTRGFLFWQTGLAFGFYPSVKIYGYEKDKLFYTVGPIVIVESFIKGFTKYFVILVIAQIVWFLVSEQHIWWWKSDA